MQAVRVERKRAPDTRWLQHLFLLGAVGFLFSWVVAARSHAGHVVEGLPTSFLAQPSASPLDWRPVRVPVRTTSQRNLAPEPLAALPPTIEAAVDAFPATAALPPALPTTAATRPDVAQWVQAHRRAPLLSAPDGGDREADVPQWSYLRVLETRPDGWLHVSYGGEVAGRPASVAWIAADDIGVSGPPPRFATSLRDATLWNADGPDADTLAAIPRLASLELAGLQRNGRVAVRVSEPDRSDRPLAWIDGDAIVGSPSPADRGLPLARAFSPFAGAVRFSIPYRTQLDGSLAGPANCGPASIGMILDGFGISISTSQARALALRTMGVNNPWTGTTLESLRDVAETYGLQGMDLREGGRYKRWSLDDARRHVRAGHPVIPQLRYRLIPGNEWAFVAIDHYVVISGLDGDDFLVSDPIRPSQPTYRLTGAQLLRAWMGSDHPGAALALARPL